MKKIGFLFLFLHSFLFAQDINYSKTKKETVVDTFYNQLVKDDYRWLEKSRSKEVGEWVSKQNVASTRYLNSLAPKVNSLTSIDRLSYVKLSNPKKEGKYYFTYAYYLNNGVPALFYTDDVDTPPSVLVDPNFISSEDKITLKSYKASADSKWLAYQFGRNGSDWGEIKLVNLKTGHHKKDHLKEVKFSGINWRGEGFYYSRFPVADFGKTLGQQIYYHKVGTAQSEDQLIFKRSKKPHITFNCSVSTDERFLIIQEIDEIAGKTNIYYQDFEAESSALRPLITKLKLSDNVSILDSHKGELIAKTFKDVNNGMIVTIDPKNPRHWKSLIPEFENSILLETHLLENRLINIYQSNGKQQIVFYDYGGNALHAIDIPFGFSVGGFRGEKEDKEILFSYEGYTQPKVVYKLNVETFEMKPLKATVVNFNYKDYETKELEYTSFDGTKVSLFLVHKKSTDITQPNPLLLKAYGGFGVVSAPHFSAGIVHFLNRGGVYAFANIRGGADKGKEWAFDGKGAEKMNSFNDFISAAEFLIDESYTSPSQLAITGASNGGLVVAVAMTQRPELFKVVVPEVAPLDMIRFENFTIGHYHTDEYGSVSSEDGFDNLMSYSPLHKVAEEVNYPATLLMTSENDDRVPPFHSYKFAAALQGRSSQKNPILLKVAYEAGHYGTTGFVKQMKSDALFYDFIIYHLMKDE